MIEIYKVLNDRRIKHGARKIMLAPPSEYWRMVRKGIKLRGEGSEYLQKQMQRELEILNTMDYEQIIEYNPRRFKKAQFQDDFISNLLYALPNGIYENALLGKYYDKYKNLNGIIDWDKVNSDLEHKPYDITDLILESIIQQIKNQELNTDSDKSIEPELYLSKEMIEYFPNAKAIYICDKTKSIIASFVFRNHLYDSQYSWARLDSWMYNPKYFIEDQAILEKQLMKIEEYRRELNIPPNDNPEQFIYWLNRDDISEEQIVHFINLYKSIGVTSLQYLTEAFDRIKLDSKYNNFKEYQVYIATAQVDPIVCVQRIDVSWSESLSNDIRLSKEYSEIYE